MTITFGGGCSPLTTTVAAFRDLTIVRETGVRKTLEVLFRGCRPAISEIRALRLCAEVESDDVFAVELALEIDQADAITDVFLLRIPSLSCLTWALTT